MSYLSRRMREEKRWSGVRGALARERELALSSLDDLQCAMLREMRRPVQRELERLLIGDVENWQPRGIRSVL